MELFTNDKINLEILKKRAFNYRWAEVPDGVIPLTAADPDFPIADEIREAMIDYIRPGYLSYTPKLGLPEFKSAIAESLNAKGEQVEADLVLPIDSVARGMYIIAEAILQAGDEAIVFDPVDYLFKNAVEAAGGKPIFFPTKIIDGRIDFSNLEDYITEKTKMFCLCNPHNPLGMVYSKEDLDRILRICEKHQLYIMNDEIWSDIVYEKEKFNSILSLGVQRNQRTLSVHGYSKAFGLAGLRIGYIYTQNQELFDKIVDVSNVLTTAGGITSISQIAGTAAITKADYWTKQFVQHLKANRDYAYQRIESMPVLTTVKPDATYLFWINISQLGISSEDFVQFMLEKVQLALVPGSEQMFGPEAEGYVRLCFATSRELLAEGLDRLERGIEHLIKSKEDSL